MAAAATREAAGGRRQQQQQPQPLRIFVFPFPTRSHMSPMLAIAKLLALRGGGVVSVTIFATPGNEPMVGPTVSAFPNNIHLVLLPEPGHENLPQLCRSDPHAFVRVLHALTDPHFVDHVRAHPPDCIITDAILLKTADISAELNIPRILFFGHAMIVSCVYHTLGSSTYNNPINADDVVVVDDDDGGPPSVIKGLPHHIEVARSDVPAGHPEYQEACVSNSCYGIVLNTFYELEPEFVDHYRKLGRRAYCVGPVSLVNKGKTNDGDIEQGGLKTWLDSKAKGSVVYACFGSVYDFSTEQLREFALGLEESGQQFLWAERSAKVDEALPDEFEERVKGKGIVVRGWVPQMLILNHPAIGGFLSHCGTNSMLESISAGVPMAVMPVEYDQFLNAKLVTHVSRIGIRAGSCNPQEKVVKAMDIAKAVAALMSRDDEEAEERRERARRYAEMANAALDEGGSTHADMTRLIDDIKEYSLSRALNKA